MIDSCSLFVHIPFFLTRFTTTIVTMVTITMITTATMPTVVPIVASTPLVGAFIDTSVVVKDVSIIKLVLVLVKDVSIIKLVLVLVKDVSIIELALDVEDVSFSKLTLFEDNSTELVKNTSMVATIFNIHVCKTVRDLECHLVSCSQPHPLLLCGGWGWLHETKCHPCVNGCIPELTPWRFH